MRTTTRPALVVPESREVRDEREARLVQIVCGVILAAMLPVIAYAIAAAWGYVPPAPWSPLGNAERIADERDDAPTFELPDGWGPATPGPAPREQAPVVVPSAPALVA